MKYNLAVLILGVSFITSRVYSYSHNGHYLVGAIADQMLVGTPTAGKVKKLIGNVSLASASTMPDQIKDWDPRGRSNRAPFKVTSNKKLNKQLEAFLRANQTEPDCTRELLHHEYHFTDIQVFDPLSYSEAQVGANPNDIVHMIPFCIEVLSGQRRATNPQKITKGVALVLLVHFIGDLHQPLHVGAEYFDQDGKPANPNQTIPAAADKGGNALRLELPNPANPAHPSHPGNLHHYWDENAVETATNNWAKQINPSNPHSVSLDDMAKFLKGNLPAGWIQEPSINPSTFALDCANEILPIAREAHQRLDFSGIMEHGSIACLQATNGLATALTTFSSDYREFSGAIAADEIQKAGHRLADLLQIILK